jgi:hypothetical protein
MKNTQKMLKPLSRNLSGVFDMLKKKLALWTICLLSFLFSTATQAQDPIKLTVTSDNAYRFALGTKEGIAGVSTTSGGANSQLNVLNPFALNPFGPMNKYWFTDVWNSDPSQISDAESYPKGTPFNTLKSDYFYIACYGGYGYTEQHPYVDVVVVIDESASMADEQQFTKKMINKFEETLTKHDFGTTNGPNRYGLVGFGFDDPNSSHPNVHPHTLNGNQLFGTPVDYANAVTGLKAHGGSTPGEDGYAGIKCALGYPWRQDAKKIIILVTDENRDMVDHTIVSANSMISNLLKHEVTLNAVVYCDIRPKFNKYELTFQAPGLSPLLPTGMAIDANNTVYTAGNNGTYTTSPGGKIQDDPGLWGVAHAKGSVTDYANVAFATGGLAGDFKTIEDYGTANYASAAADSFANLFSTQILGQATSKNPYRGVIAEVLDANSNAQYPFDLQAGKWQVYATGVHGNQKGIWSASNPPSIGEINQHIQKANTVTGGLGTSLGWVGSSGWVWNGAGQWQSGFQQYLQGALVTGEQNNSNSGYFNIVSPMQSATRWMWYNPDPVNVNLPFETGLAGNGQNDGSKEFLVFRLRVEDLRPTRRSSGDPRTSPVRTSPVRTSPVRTSPSRTDRPPTIRRPVNVRPDDHQRGADRPVDFEKDSRKPVVDQPANGNQTHPKSDRENPDAKKQTERKKVQIKPVIQETTKRRVLLKK